MKESPSQGNPLPRSLLLASSRPVCPSLRQEKGPINQSRRHRRASPHSSPTSPVRPPPPSSPSPSAVASHRWPRSARPSSLAANKWIGGRYIHRWIGGAERKRDERVNESSLCRRRGDMPHTSLIMHTSICAASRCTSGGGCLGPCVGLVSINWMCPSRESRSAVSTNVHPVPYASAALSNVVVDVMEFSEAHSTILLSHASLAPL